MKLYNADAPSPRRVRIFLAEKGLTVPMVEVDVYKGGARSPDYLAKNPFGGVPLLELDDGSFIAESIAITRYFEALHPDPPLFGVSPAEQARVDEWLRRIDGKILAEAGVVWINDSPITAAAGRTRHPERAVGARQRLAGYYEIFDRHFARSEYFAGPSYTAADAHGLAIMDFATKRVGVPYDDALSHLRRWHDAVSARPSAKA